MRKSRMKPIVGALLLGLVCLAANGQGPWRIEIWQAGAPGARVAAGSEFQIRGEGFHATVLPIKVCVFDSQCQLATPERGGNFTLNRSITQPGTYEIRVFQARDINISEWRLRASETVTVTN